MNSRKSFQFTLNLNPSETDQYLSSIAFIYEDQYELFSANQNAVPVILETVASRAIGHNIDVFIKSPQPLRIWRIV